jgi:predicted secreted protein
MYLALFSIAVMELVQRIDLRQGAVMWVGARPAWQRWALYTGLVGTIIFFGSYYNTTQFIYFQF